MLVERWKSLGSELPENWRAVELSLRLEQVSEAETAARLLGPAQPYRPEPDDLRFRVARDGSAPSPDGIQRLLRRIDELRIHGRLSIVSTERQERVEPPAEQEVSLVEAWQSAEAALPSDWSHVYAELEVTSTDYVEPASLYCVPMNLRRVGDSTRLRFRAARTFGYGASPIMVRRCLERCDEHGIKGTVRVLNAVSDADPVWTQGPVWMESGSNV